MHPFSEFAIAAAVVCGVLLGLKYVFERIAEGKSERKGDPQRDDRPGTRED